MREILHADKTRKLALLINAKDVNSTTGQEGNV